MTNKDVTLDTEIFFETVQRANDRRRLLDVAIEDLVSDGNTFCIAQKSNLYLQAVRPVVTRVTVMGHLAGSPLEIRRGQIVKHERDILIKQVLQTRMQRLLDGGLRRRQVLERPVVPVQGKGGRRLSRWCQGRVPRSR